MQSALTGDQPPSFVADTLHEIQGPDTIRAMLCPPWWGRHRGRESSQNEQMPSSSRWQTSTMIYGVARAKVPAVLPIVYRPLIAPACPVCGRHSLCFFLGAALSMFHDRILLRLSKRLCRCLCILPPRPQPMCVHLSACRRTLLIATHPYPPQPARLGFPNPIRLPHRVVADYGTDNKVNLRAPPTTLPSHLQQSINISLMIPRGNPSAM